MSPRSSHTQDSTSVISFSLCCCCCCPESGRKRMANWNQAIFTNFPLLSSQSVYCLKWKILLPTLFSAFFFSPTLGNLQKGFFDGIFTRKHTKRICRGNFPRQTLRRENKGKPKRDWKKLFSRVVLMLSISASFSV